ncbi:uncharacterized protein si:dkey-75a21.2 [Oncorhynchus nerka]|uniref:uncharacterized protein si:dkey-75a21.2 n=1 Tax=Oncorhynchus nerka TaxID=8023 RepID=UPI0031B7F561
MCIYNDALPRPNTDDAGPILPRPWDTQSRPDVIQPRSFLKLKLCSGEEVHKWLKDFQRTSDLTWRKRSTSARSTNNTCCGAIMYFIPKRLIHSQRRESRQVKTKLLNLHMKGGCLFHGRLRNGDNHSLTSAEVLKRRNVSADTIEKLTKLFEIGHSLSSALNMIKYELHVEYGDNHVHASVDSSICPSFNSATSQLLDTLDLLIQTVYLNVITRNHFPTIDCGNVSEDTVVIECAPVSDVNGSGTSGKPAEGATLEDDGMEIFEDLKKKMREDLVSFRPKVASFVSSFKKMKTDSELIAALSNFGKTNPGPTAKFRQGHARPAKSSIGERGHGTCCWKRKAPH